MLSRLVITFLSRSKHLLISWLQSPSAVILEPKKIKSVTISTVSPSICREVMGPDAMCPRKAQKGEGRGYAHLGPSRCVLFHFLHKTKEKIEAWEDKHLTQDHTGRKGRSWN